MLGRFGELRKAGHAYLCRLGLAGATLSRDEDCLRPAGMRHHRVRASCDIEGMRWQLVGILLIRQLLQTCGCALLCLLERIDRKNDLTNRSVNLLGRMALPQRVKDGTGRNRFE